MNAPFPEDFPNIVRSIFRSWPTIIEGDSTLFIDNFQVKSWYFGSIEGL